MVFPSFSFPLHLAIVSCFGGDPLATSAGLVYLAQDFAPPKPLIDVLVEKSPALTVKLWGKVQLGRREVWNY